MPEDDFVDIEKDSIESKLGKTPKLLGKIRSQIDKIDDIEIRPDGSVVHKILRTYIKPDKKIPKKQRKNIKKPLKEQNRGAYREWPSFEKFKAWRTKHFKKRSEFLQARMTPLQFYVTQGIGHERPFTNDYYWTKDVGQYSCSSCT